MNYRYCRQIPIIGKEGQLYLTNTSILVIGAGGVGSPLLLYLASAGIGNLGVIDFDSVELANLNRQILFTETDIGKNKARQGVKRLKKLNSDISINSYSEKVTLKNAKRIFKKYNLIIDGSDNFQTKYLANDICCQLGLPLISISIYQSQIQIVIIDPKKACYRCVFPEPPPPNLVQNCSFSGIIGANAGISGSMAASIAIQMLTNSSCDFFNQIIKINCDNYSIDKLEFMKQSNCKACSNKLISWPAITYRIRLEDIDIKDYLIVDLRESFEDKSKNFSSKQQNIPFTEFIKKPYQLPKVKILFYCSGGIRSEYSAHLLRKKGYEAFSIECNSS